MTRVVLTGTTGKLGSRILRSLMDKRLIEPKNLIISCSDPGRLPQDIQRVGIDVRYGDFADGASLRRSFEGGDVLFLISHPDPGTARVRLHQNAIEAARDAGIRTVIYSSMMFGGQSGLQSVIGIQQGHIQTVEYLVRSGLDFVVVRQGIYAQAWGIYAGFQNGLFRKDDHSPLEWVIPNDGAIAWTDLDELGEGNASIIVEHERYRGQTLRLTGPRATTLSDIARLVETRTGRSVLLRLVGTQAAVDYHCRRMGLGSPSTSGFVQDNWGGWYQGLANGEGEVVDPLLGTLLGRQARGIEEMADELFTPR